MCKKLSFLVSCILVLSLVSNASAVIGQKDIDSPGIPGSAIEVGGVWTISGSGHDIWGTGDALHYVYRPMADDGEIIVDLTSRTMDPLHDWSKIGVMIRETSDTGSKSCAFVYTAQAEGSGSEYQIAYRPATGLDSYSVDTAMAEMPPAIPQTLKILRAGDTIQAWWYKEVIKDVLYQWTMFGQVDIPMASDVLIGMAVCSHDNAVLCTAVYENVVWPAGPYEKPWDLLPVDGAGPLPLQPELTWMRGDSAALHDIYLGTDPAALVHVATRPVGVESYIPGTPLDGGTVYYWQIVEQPLNIPGPILSFKTERPGFGTIQRCVWEGIEGTNVSDLINNPAYPDSPTWCDELPSMGYTDFADNYGARMQGYLVPETSGDYTFWIAGDDSIALWLSSDDTSCNLAKIAEHVGWTSNYNWFDAPEQQSAAIPLVGGQKYLIRSLHKEGGGGDGCQVAWSGPDQPVWPVQGNSAAMIDGYFLQPANDPYASKLYPPDGSAFTPLEAEEPVSWAPGHGAVAHNVYFGPDPGSMVLVGTVAMPDTSFVLPAIPVGTTAYWGVEADDGTQTYPPCSASSITVQEWISMDIGRANPWPAGSSSYDEATGVYTLHAGGNELWGTWDEFHYLYTTMEMTRNAGEIKARVLSIAHLGADWSRGGVQIRESRAPNSRKVMAHKTAADNTRMQWREQPSWDTWNTGDNYGLGWPLWVRLVRDGEQYNGYYSYDDQNWTHLGGMWCPMPSDKYVCIGLALCHHNGAPQDQLATATFDNLSIKTADPLAAWSPSPSDGASNIPLDVTLSWNPGEGAGSHLLYISQNYEDVLYGLVSPIPLPAETTEYNIGKLELGKPYYWCVDELRREGRDVLVAFGDIWSFQVEPYRVLEDFEPYCIIPDPLPEQVEVPGEILVEAVPPPDNTVIVDGYTIPGYTIEAVPPDGACLLAEWAFEGNFEDTSGSGFHGTPVGVATIVTDAERGDVLSLGGDQDYVDCGNPAELNFSTGNWSLSAWVKNTMVGTGDDNKGAIIANGGDGGGGHRYCLIQSEQEEAEVTLVTDNDVDKRQARGDLTKVNDDVWHHVLGVREGSVIRIYIDGIEEGSAGLPDGYDLSGTVQANVLIGAMTLASDSSIYKTYAGLIDDAQIYNCALTEGNARYLAGIGNLVIDPIVVPPIYGPLLIHWAFDEGAGDVAADSSGNGNDGAISSAAWTTTTADGSAACLDFEGGSNVVTEACGGLLNGLGAMTISMWIQSDDINSDQGFLIFEDPSGKDRRGMRYDSAGASGGGDDVIKYGISTSDGSEESESSVMIQTTEWQHIMITWSSGAGTKLYINGILDAPSYDGADIAGVLAGYNKMIAGKGGKDDGSTESWDGRIDDVRIYNYVVTEGERRYLAGLGDVVAPPSFQPLLAEYLFEGNADDTSGNNNHATPLGDATIVLDAVKGYVATFDGDGDAGNIGNNPLFNFTDDCTISAWVNMTSWGDGWGNVIVGKRGEGGVGWQLRRFGSDPRFSWTTRGLGNDDYPRSNLVPNMNQWYHLAAVREGTQKRLYIDGKIDSTADVSDGQIASCDHDVYIGARANGDNTGPESFFNGMIDEVRIYNTALTYEQVSGLAGCENPLINTWFSNGGVMPQLDYTVAHGGNQSMKIKYNGGPSQVMRIPPFDDWGAGNARALTLYFKGDAGNMPGQLFVQMKAGCMVEYSGSPEDVMNPDWQEWNVDLADFDCWPSPATLLSVGISEGSGVLWFDDMRLYPSRCVPSLSSITDLNQDCSVDGKDLRILAADYLMGDFTVSPETPDAAGLLAHYEFNDNYDDSSGNDNHGIPVGDGITIEDDPTMGKVLSLPGGSNVFVDCNDVGNSGNMPVTIACWAKADNTSIPDWSLIFGFTTEGGDCGSHFNIGSIGGPGGVGAHVWCWEATIFTDEEALEWRHYAMTFDGGTVKYYGDGSRIGEIDYDLWRRADNVHIGSRITQDSSFPGKVDDARIYNYDLSWGEIRSLAGLGDLYVPLDSIANIYDEEPVNSKKVNLKDYALIGNDWLFEIVWP